MQCDMCGKETRLFTTEIEGTKLNVCKDCSKFGRVISAAREQQQTTGKPLTSGRIIAIPIQEEITEKIVEDYAQIIKTKREKLGLTQEELAKKINEKESQIHKIESGQHEPNIEFATKLEKFLGVKLIEQYKEEKIQTSASGTDELTIGDIIKFKRK